MGGKHLSYGQYAAPLLRHGASCGELLWGLIEVSNSIMEPYREETDDGGGREENVRRTCSEASDRVTGNAAYIVISDI